MTSTPLPAGSQAIKHGTHIFVYNNIRTKQVIYSLTRAMKNNTSLKQLPYLGKKTVPASLRKDLWTPLALLSFPSALSGLTAYRKLREYRRLHETAYPLSRVTQTTGKHAGQLMPKKAKGKVLMNQLANSVADMAAVLLQQEKGLSKEQIQRAERRVRKDGRPPAKRGLGRQKESAVLEEGMEKGVEGVTIRWANMLDAEYAEAWPRAVVHDGLEKSRYTAAFPVMEAEAEEIEDPAVEEETVGDEAAGSSQEGKVVTNDGEGVEASERGIKNLEKRVKRLDVQEKEPDGRPAVATV
ncbi:MAG: hypothetical protein Q9187_002023 [Circinaria calcarea]